MKTLQSKSGKCYEYDPSIPPIEVDAYWSCFSGRCVSDTIQKSVIIYITNTNVRVSEQFLAWLKNIPTSVFYNSNIIGLTDYIEETSTNGTIIRSYIILTTFCCVSLSGLIHGQTDCINGKTIEFALQMYELYEKNRVGFAKTVARDILNGLDHLHSKGISVGCIDPDYILFTEDKRIAINFMGAYHWYIVKQSMYRERNTRKYSYGTINGNHVVMVAPELLNGNVYHGDLNDGRIDLYSLGIMLFYILEGHLPDSFINLVANQKMPLHEIKEKHFRRIIKKATEKEPSKRYQSAIEFINAIDKIDEDVVWYKKLYSIFGFFRKKEG